MERQFDQWSPNFVEAVACAMSETVYSAALAWLLSTAELPMAARRAILRALSPELPDRITISGADRERPRRIDVLAHVEVDGVIGVVAIENKIKALEHSQQLAVYDQAMAEEGMHAYAKVFLTLVGNAPASGIGWRSARYSELLVGLRRAEEIAPAHPYLSGFTAAVGRLVAATDLVTTSAAHARLVFDGAHAEDRMRDFSAYVSCGRIRDTLKMGWLAALGRRAIDGRQHLWTAKAGKGHEVLVNVERVVNIDGVEVNMGLQLEPWRLQAFAEPHPYSETSTASERQRAAVDACIEQIRRVLSLPPSQRTGTPGRRYHRGLRIPATAPEFDAAAWAERMAELLPALETMPSTGNGQ